MHWTAITGILNPHDKAVASQNTISQIVDGHCPAKRKDPKHAKTPWFDDLAKKLRNAKCKAYNKGSTAAKFLTPA